MKFKQTLKPAILCMMFVSSIALSGQTLRMTFTASGASDKVDSVKATNLRTNQHVTLPGADTLYLAVNTGIGDISGKSGQNLVFPNPCQGKATLLANVQSAQPVTLAVYTLRGQLIARMQAVVEPGSNAFTISLPGCGVYMVSLSTSTGTTATKVISTGPADGSSGIRYAGNTPGGQSPSFKSATIYSLGYSVGDVVLYRCRGGIHATIITDAPVASKNYTVEFAPCIDPAGRSYATVTIGSQVWMAENLAWLPAVSTSAAGADSVKHYYVYNYDDTIVDAAKNTPGYQVYGVLYNWPAAMNAGGPKSAVSGLARAACPAGWHMPDDDEWKTLEKALGMSQADADTLYWRISGEAGKKLKSSVGWQDNGNGINSSGFTALPGGYRNIHGGFLNGGTNSLFWTASVIDSTSWYRSLGATDQGVYRISTYRSQGFSVRCVKDPR
ncbi:MAG: T9SS type A sorting domain-containing protein [Bacteroidetes bacterium]|nr:T9SS type A sorting domain-containing protein [Bacteroidota bacterium]